MNTALIDFEHYRGAEIAGEIMHFIYEQRQLHLIQSLQAKFSKDGNQFCFLYGEMPNDCVVGFGDTAQQAMENFCKNFWHEKAVVVKTKPTIANLSQQGAEC